MGKFLLSMILGTFIFLLVVAIHEIIVMVWQTYTPSSPPVWVTLSAFGCIYGFGRILIWQYKKGNV